MDNTTIIILTYNHLDYTKLCLESIRECTNNYNIIFIDNGSTDDTVKWLQEQSKYADIKTVIFNSENKGFPAGCNHGAKLVEDEYICFLNNDTIVTPNWLGNLLNHINGEQSFKIIGPCTNYISGEQKFITDIYNNNNELYNIAIKFYNNNKPSHKLVNWLIGFCMIMKIELFNELGGFDESYGLGNWEDIDFCMKARQKNISIGIARDVYIHHFESITNRSLNNEYLKLLQNNKRIFLEKWKIIPKQLI